MPTGVEAIRSRRSLFLIMTAQRVVDSETSISLLFESIPLVPLRLPASLLEVLKAFSQREEWRKTEIRLCTFQEKHRLRDFHTTIERGPILSI